MQDAEPEPVIEETAHEPVAPPPAPHAQQRPQAHRVRALPKPLLPTRADREKHELTHLPYETWCRHCVRARSLNDPHGKTKKHSTAREVPVVSGDFCFMGQTDQDKAGPIFVMRDHNTRITFAHMVEGKSTTNQTYSEYLHRAVLKDPDTWDTRRWCSRVTRSHQ